MTAPNLLKYSLITLLGVLLFIPMLGKVHLFDWDEINFAECAREMIVSGDYIRMQIDYLPFWEKPPLFIWLQAASMQLFGINEFAARFPNALAGVVTLAVLFYAGKRIVNEKMAGWWALLYAATWLPHFYFKSGIIDPIFNLFIFLAFFQFYLLGKLKDKTIHAFLSGLFLGLAVLTKGPAAIVIAALSLAVYIVYNKGLWGYSLKHILLTIVSSFLPFGLWFCLAVLEYGWTYGSWFMGEFITYQIRLFSTEDAGHGGPFFYHFIVLLIGCFPAAPFLFQYRRNRSADTENVRSFSLWMWILFWVTLLLFSIVKTKIVHYSSLCYFPLTFLAAVKMYQLSEKTDQLKTVVKVLLLVVGTLLAILISLLPLVGIYKDLIIPYVDDPFAVGNFQANVSWQYSEMIWGILYLIGIWCTVFYMRRNFKNAMLILCLIQIVLIQVTVTHFTPKIEAYSQRAAIEFFKGLSGKDVYVKVLGYKSYAHLFYTQKTPIPQEAERNEAWFLEGDLDKPVWFITKNTYADNLRKYPQVKEIGQQNGFVFFRRDPP
jgi:4-amino-4-deoxy-L-arabinose transferase-like glycosyltransferase